MQANVCSRHVDLKNFLKSFQKSIDKEEYYVVYYIQRLREPTKNQGVHKMEDIMKKLDQMDGVTYELIGSWLWVSGETKKYKEEIKEMGGRWAPKKKLWYFQPEGTRNFKGRTNMDMDTIRQKYGA